VNFAEGFKVLFCGLPFGLSRHATEQFIEHEASHQSVQILALEFARWFARRIAPWEMHICPESS
jgi:hypothetical protein